MKAFRFALEPVLALRRQVEERRKIELAAAAQDVARQRQRLSGWLAEMEETKAAMRTLKSGGPKSGVQSLAADAGGRTLDLFELRVHEGYLNSLTRRITEGFAELERRRGIEDEKRRALVRARQDRRAIERLRERRHAEWRYQAGREEQKFLDEVGQQGFLRARANA